MTSEAIELIMPRFKSPEGIDDVDVRVGDVGESENESIGVDAQSVHSLEDLPDDVALLLSIDASERNLDECLKGAGWRVAAANDEGIVKILAPTTSKIPHEVTHPCLLRHIMDAGDGLLGFARTLNSPIDFEARLIEVMADSILLVRAYLNDLSSLPDNSAESRVQSAIFELITRLAASLRIPIRVRASEKMAVGGILARNEYDIKGLTDICVFNRDDECLLVIEVKTVATFFDEKWYRDCRAAQILTPLYHFNAPTFLATSRQFKVFFENSERDTIFTYPTRRVRNLDPIDDFQNSLPIGTIDTEFIKALIICLTAKPTDTEPDYSVRVAVPSNFGISTYRSVPSSAQKEPKPKRQRNHNEVNPSFKSIKSDGTVVSVAIRIFHPEELEEYDEENEKPRDPNVFETVDEKCVG